jgi:hypothetical protein
MQEEQEEQQVVGRGPTHGHQSQTIEREQQGQPPEQVIQAVDEAKGTSTAATAGAEPRASANVQPQLNKQALSARVNFWATIVTALTAAAALILSLVTSLQLNSRPAMVIAMPKVMNILTTDQGVSVALAPTFTVYEKTDLSAQVTDVSFSLTGPTGQRPTFFWIDNVAFELTDNGFRDRWASDPSPLTVTQDGAQTPTFRFYSYDRDFLAEGRWSAALTVHRLKQAPLVVNICLTLNEATVTQASTNAGNWWYLRRDGSFITTESTVTDTHCYR